MKSSLPTDMWFKSHKCKYNVSAINKLGIWWIKWVYIGLLYENLSLCIHYMCYDMSSSKGFRISVLILQELQEELEEVLVKTGIKEKDARLAQILLP